MKNIYFVRHGESEANVGNIKSNSRTPLTENGHAQAAKIAERCVRLEFDVIISSTMTRAHDTALAIADATGKPLESSDLFTERRAPSEQEGQLQQKEFLAEMKEIAEHYAANPDFHFSDEENFTDLKKRAMKALEFLENRSEENIVVVTHGIFLRMIVACAIIGETATAEEFLKLLATMRHANTGITVFRYDSTREYPWVLWTWNDHAHLG